MTEYEMASLALAQAEAVRDQTSLVQAQVELLLQLTALYATVLTAFLVMAHFVGRALSRFQAIMVSVFYLAIIMSNRASFYIAYNRYIELEAGLAQLKSQQYESPLPVELFVLVTVLIIFASVYFLWSVRRAG
jgi:hypothetical protein